jgi:hypothetical protein
LTELPNPRAAEPADCPFTDGLPMPDMNYRQQNLNRSPAMVAVGFICPQFFGFIFSKLKEPENGLRA